MKPVLLAAALVLSGCATTEQNPQVRATASAARPTGGAGQATPAEPTRGGLIASLDRVGQAVSAAARGEGGQAPGPAATGSASLGPLETGAAPAGAARASAPGRRTAARIQRDPASLDRSEAARGSRSAAVAYEQAMLRRDARAMARAATRLTGRGITEESIRALNAQLGIEADDEIVSAVVRAAR